MHNLNAGVMCAWPYLKCCVILCDFFSFCCHWCIARKHIVCTIKLQLVETSDCIITSRAPCRDWDLFETVEIIFLRHTLVMQNSRLTWGCWSWKWSVVFVVKGSHLFELVMLHELVMCHESCRIVLSKPGPGINTATDSRIVHIIHFLCVPFFGDHFCARSCNIWQLCMQVAHWSTHDHVLALRKMCLHMTYPLFLFHPTPSQHPHHCSSQRVVVLESQVFKSQTACLLKQQDLCVITVRG